MPSFWQQKGPKLDLEFRALWFSLLLVASTHQI
jgi:hypothetical protein